MTIDLKTNRPQAPIVPEGNHLARLYQIVELGTLPLVNKPGEFARKIMFTFELPEELREFDGEQKPMVISADYFVSMWKTSTLRRAVEGIAGKLTEEEASEFDVKTLLGKPCMVNVVHTVSKTNGNTYANIAGVTPLPKAIKEVPAQVNESRLLGYGENWDEETYTKLPDWIKRKMEQSEEMKRKVSGSETDGNYPENDLGPSGF